MDKEPKKHTKIVTVEYLVSSCPIMGKIVIKHYVEKDGKNK